MAEPRTEGSQASPGAQTLLASTRNLSQGGAKRVSWGAYGAVPFEILLEHVRGAGVVWGQIIPVTTALVTGELPFTLQTQPGDVIRLRTRSAVIGEVQATLAVEP